MIKKTKSEKVNRTEKVETVVLNKINLEANENELVSIMIPSSGCRKFTFEPKMFNETVAENKRNNLQKANIGFAVQSFNRIKCAVIATFLFCGSLFGQYENIIVSAGTKIMDNFPPSVRYLYPQFVQGQIVLKNNKTSAYMINYNMLQNEIEFINGNDTLIIGKKKDLKYVIVENDTFTYSSGYVKHIFGQELKIYCKDKINFKDILKKGAMGVVNRSAGIETNSSLDSQALSYDLVVSEDMVFRREVSYYVTTSNGSLEQFKKQNVLKQFSNHKAEIQKYLKTNNINFQKQEDIVKLAGYLSAL